jgi:predicted PurR-regulated permease PerM
MTYSPFYRRCFAIGTVLVLGYLLLQFLDPFFGPLGWAAILAFLLYPLHVRLTKRLRGREGYSAGILTGLTPFLILAPLAGFGAIFAQQVGHLVEYMRARPSLMSYPAALEKLESFPIVGRAVAWLGAEVSVTAEQIQQWVVSGAQAVLKTAAAAGGSFALGVVGTLVGFFLMMFLLFFLLRDGRSMIAHTMRLVPLDAARREKLQTFLADVSRAVIFGHALTAIIQGTLVGIGFAIAGLPSPVVFAVLAGIAAFIPAAGTGLVLVPAVIYLAVAGRWGAAIFLGIWAVGVGFSDNFLRPYLTRQRAEVATLTVFVGVIGGVSAFGFIGSLIGPVVLALIVALLQFAEAQMAKND